jgi:hypothetical protein
LTRSPGLDGSTASSHTKGQDQFSSNWIGIGGGGIDANCMVGDNTLIQTGTEGRVIGAPSAPDPDADGFNACTWATSCSAPSGC